MLNNQNKEKFIKQKVLTKDQNNSKNKLVIQLKWLIKWNRIQVTLKTNFNKEKQRQIRLYIIQNN